MHTTEIRIMTVVEGFQSIRKIVGEAVGGKRRIFNFLESAPIRLFRAFENRKLPPLTFPKTFKTSRDLVRDQGVGSSNPLSPMGESRPVNPGNG